MPHRNRYPTLCHVEGLIAKPSPAPRLPLPEGQPCCISSSTRCRIAWARGGTSLTSADNVKVSVFPYCTMMIWFHCDRGMKVPEKLWYAGFARGWPVVGRIFSGRQLPRSLVIRVKACRA